LRINEQHSTKSTSLETAVYPPDKALAGASRSRALMMPDVTAQDNPSPAAAYYVRFADPQRDHTA
jgi:hypothetical protein